MTSNASPRKTSSIREIPNQRVLVNDPSQIPIDYSTTPGGTIFSTTPGGTRIIYERAFLMQMRNSPVARTPPKNLPIIPGVTSPSHKPKETKKSGKPKENGVVNGPFEKQDSDETLFTMDV